MGPTAGGDGNVQHFLNFHCGYNPRECSLVFRPSTDPPS